MPLNHQSLIIVTYGRSGSTLLQGLLNTIPGCVVRGENNNFCYGLFLAWHSLVQTQAHRDETQPENPWYGANQLSASKFIESAREIIERQLIGDATLPRPACLGFKEIRYLQTELAIQPKDYPGRLRDYLQFLGRVMPGLGIVFLTRDLDQVCRSAWWRDIPEPKVRSWLTAFEGAIKGFRAEGVQTYRIDYAQVLANGEAMRGLFEFMGADYVPERVAAVLSREHSFQAPTVDAKVTPDTASAAVVKPTWRTEVVKALRGFSWVSPDNPAWPEGPEGCCVWNGVAVAANMPHGMRLGLILPGGQEVPVAWGHPSPWAASRFPEWSWAATARYCSPNFTLAIGQRVSLVGHGPRGDETLAWLERQS